MTNTALSGKMTKQHTYGNKTAQYDQYYEKEKEKTQVMLWIN